MGASRKQGFISRMFPEVAEIAQVTQEQGHFSNPENTSYKNA